MAISAVDLKNDDTTDAGFDLILDSITSPATGKIGITRIDVGTSTTVVRMDSSNPLFAQLTAGTAEIGKLAAGAAEIGSVKWAGTSPPIGAGTETAALRVTIATDSTGVLSIDDNGSSLTVDNAGLTELAAAINSSKLDIDIASSTVDVMLGSDFSNVLGTASLILTTQADNVVNTSDGLQTTSFLYVYDGSTWDRLRGDSTNGMLVNLGSNNDVVVTNAGTFAIQIVDTSFAVADGNALGEGVLVQGDDGTDRKNIHVDASTGDVQVDVTEVVPGTGATNSGKAIGTSVGSTDTGVALLAKLAGDTAHVSESDGEYVVVEASEFGALHVEPEQHHVLDQMDSTSGWAALGNDTLNLGLATEHVLGTNALKFDKVDGDANTIFAGIEKTLSSVNLGGLSPHDILQTVVYMSDVANVAYVFLRLGSTSSAYNEWRIAGIDLSAGVWETLLFEVGDASFAGGTGSGVNWADLDYIAIGVAFNAETNTLAGITFDEISFHTNQHVNASLNSEVTSSVNSANVNVQKIGNKVVNTQAGTVSTGTQRITLGSDDPAVVALQVMDDWDETNRAAVNIIASQAGVVGGTGTDAANALRVSLATDIPLPAGTNAIGKMAANSGVDIGDVDILSIAAGDNNIGNVDIVTLPASTNTLEVVGDVAHSAAAAGNPVAVAARATNSMEGLTQVSAAEATFITSDLNGVLVTRPHTTLEELVSYSVSNTAGTEIAVTGLDAGGTGIHNYITAVTVHNSHATTNGFIQLLDGSGGSAIWTFPNPAGGGTTMVFNPPLKQPTANTALYFDGSAAITTAYISINGFQAQG